MKSNKCEKVIASEKGSVTVIVLVTILFIVVILSSFLVYITSRRKAQVKETEAISIAYDDDMERVYKEIAENRGIKKKITEINGYETQDTETEDRLGNKLTIPQGFKVVNPNSTVNEGIVIEDVTAKDSTTIGNQFVWIPCTIDGANNTIKYDRYAFQRSDWEYSQTKLEDKDIDGSYKITMGNETYYFHEPRNSENERSIEIYGGYYFR